MKGCGGYNNHNFPLVYAFSNTRHCTQPRVGKFVAGGNSLSKERVVYGYPCVRVDDER